MKRRYVFAPEAALDLVKFGVISSEKAARGSQIVLKQLFAAKSFC